MVAPFSPIDNRFETRLADAEAFLSRGLDTGTGMLGMAANPAAEAVAAGYDIPDDTVEAFNAVFAEEIAPRLIAARKAVELTSTIGRLTKHQAGLSARASSWLSLPFSIAWR